MQQTTTQETQPSAYLVIQIGNRWTEVVRLAVPDCVSIGRSSNCEIVVREDAVSRQHARVSPQKSGWLLEDLGSRNGTLVGEERLEKPHLLKEGDQITVGSMTMVFTHSLSSIGIGPQDPPVSLPSNSNTVALDRPAIVDRLSNSRWSIPKPAFLQSEATRTSRPSDEGHFFYSLVFDLVRTSSAEEAAQVALDHLTERLGNCSGGVVAVETFEQVDDKAELKDRPSKTHQAGQTSSGDDDVPDMIVQATRQPSNGAYHRISDFLVKNLLRDKQALLARNVMGDSNLSFERQSGRRDTVSIICAPIFCDAERKEIWGIIHVYTSGDQRTLTNQDLELVVGVADNLAFALTRQGQQNALVEKLNSTQRRIDELTQQLAIASEMVGSSQQMAIVQKAIRRAAPTQATVLIRGESGVGKELVARALHLSSTRSDGPLVCLNCAALAPTLLESELFGHEKGAFTGATDRKIGKFEAANGGTLFLDEIGEMPLELQAKFLRVLEGQPFERLGGNKPITTKVRVVAATNRDLESAVEAKEFRADLYFRLRVVEIEVPPLRERREDIPELVQHFIKQLLPHAGGRKLSGIAPDALQLLTRHDWPGNIRELRNVLERAIVLGDGAVIGCEDLSIAAVSGLELVADSQTPDLPSARAFQPISLAELETQHIYSVLDHTDGNKTQAAKLLGIERSTLDRKLKRLEAK